MDVDRDVLESAKELAAKRRTTAGRILSDLARIALAPQTYAGRNRNGVPVLPKNRNAKLVMPDIVNWLRDEA